MTVQELIERLQRVEDKSRMVVIEKFEDRYGCLYLKDEGEPQESIGFYDLEEIDEIDEHDCIDGARFLNLIFQD